MPQKRTPEINNVSGEHLPVKLLFTLLGALVFVAVRATQQQQL